MSKIGIDIVEIDRIKRAVERRNDKFLNSVFTEREIEYFKKKKFRAESIAGGFAAKEAFSKYLGTGIRGFELKDIEVLHNFDGKPYLVFKGSKSSADLSISHTDKTAAAVVVGEGDENGFRKSKSKTESQVGFSEEKELNGYMSLNLPMQRFVGLKKTEDELEKLHSYLEEMRKLIPTRVDTAHKGDCGKVFIIAGSKGMTGAAVLSANAALRTGSGLVTVGIAECEQPVVASKLTEAMTYPLCCDEEQGTLSASAVEKVLENASKSDVVAMGMGLGRNDDVRTVVKKVILNCDKPIILDADGLNAISDNVGILLEAKNDIIVTPHIGEMQKLTGIDADYINRNREEVAVDFAKKYRATVVLKGKNTVIASKFGDVFINITGNSGMATGGSGDVLSGIIASLKGQGLPSFNAARLGAFVHGFAGDFAAGDKGILGMIAWDIVENIPYAIKYILE